LDIKNREQEVYPVCIPQSVSSMLAWHSELFDRKTDCILEVIGVAGFDYVEVGSKLLAFGNNLLPRGSGIDNNRDLFPIGVLFNSLQAVLATEYWHIKIQENEVRGIINF